MTIVLQDRPQEADLAFATARIRILERLAAGEPLGVLLEDLVLAVEGRCAGVACSILLADDDGMHLRLGAAPSLPLGYRKAIDGAMIGPASGSCAAAALRREPVVVEDLAADPLRDACRDALLPHGVRACWSTPVLDPAGGLLGTLAVFLREPGPPPETLAGPVEIATRTAGIVIGRHRADAALRESEAHHRAVVECAAEGIFVIDSQGRILDVNAATSKALGYSREELLRMNTADTLAAGEMDCAEPERARVESGLVGRSEWLFRRGDGTVFPAEISATALPDGRLLGLMHDITQRRRTEETQRLAEARLRLALASSNVGLFDWDMTTNRVSYSREWKRQIGYEEHEISDDFAEWQSRCHPDDLDGVLARIGEYSRAPSGAFRCEFRFRHRDGRWLWILTSAEMLRDMQGRPVRMLGCHVDITDRKLTEMALAESEDRYRDLFENSEELICTHDLEGRILSVNPWTERLLGRTREELMQMHVRDILAPETRHEFEAYLSTIRRDGAARGLIRVETAAGERRILECHHTLRTEGVATPVVRGMAHDVTEKKRAADALAASERKYRELTESLSDVVYRADAATRRTTYVNAAVRDLYGYSPEEWLADPDLREKAVLPEDRERVFSAFLDAREKRQSASVDYRIVHRDAGIRWVDDRFRWELDDRGEPLFLAGIMTDITARKHAEESIELARQRLKVLSRRLMEVQEEERRQIAREMHDEIGQALTAVRISLQTMRRGSPGIVERLDETAAVVDRLLHQVRSLSLVLRPPLLDDLGLVPALRWLTSQQSRLVPIAVEFHDGAMDRRFGAEIETACFRVAQEALNNVVKHAAAQRASVSVEARHDGLHLSVRDDGVGFDVAAARLHALEGASLGMLSMEERARLVGGGVEWVAGPEGGTEVQAWFPLVPDGGEGEPRSVR